MLFFYGRNYTLFLQGFTIINKIINDRLDFYKDKTHNLGDLAIAVKNEVDEDGKALSCYLLDKLLNLNKNQTLTDDVLTKIYEEAAQSPYRKAGEECSPCSITKQSVKNELHKIQFPENFQEPETKKEVEYLYIDADEYHYHLQFKAHPGDIETNEFGRKLNGAMTKMAYVYEGIEPEEDGAVDSYKV